MTLCTTLLGEQAGAGRRVVRQFDGEADERRGRRGPAGRPGLRLAGDGGGEQQRDENGNRSHQASCGTGTAGGTGAGTRAAASSCSSQIDTIGKSFVNPI